MSETMYYGQDKAFGIKHSSGKLFPFASASEEGLIEVMALLFGVSPEKMTDVIKSLGYEVVEVDITPRECANERVE